MTEPIGHRLAQGRTYTHIIRIDDGGVVSIQERDGRYHPSSVLHERVLCGKMRGGAMRSRDMADTQAGTERIHADRLKRDGNGWPDFPLEQGHKSYGSRIPCAACYSIYRAERAARTE